MDPVSSTDLILNQDGSVYHLSLLPEDIAETIILVGDPGRVSQVSSRFSRVDTRKANREFLTHTGTYKGKPVSVVSTGIGTDNIDIVVNELDALVNVKLEDRTVSGEKRPLNLIRLGTTGALQEDIGVGTPVLSHIAGGLDGLCHFYRDGTRMSDGNMTGAFIAHTNWNPVLPEPYFIRCSEHLQRSLIQEGFIKGITLTTPGFYGPQLRTIRIPPMDATLMGKIGSFRYEGLRITNFEMECSALYVLASLLGHRAITVCTAIANRITGAYMQDYRNAVEDMITAVLEKLATDDGSPKRD